MAQQNRLPTGDGASTQWTPNTGTRWEACDDPIGSPDNDTTYISSASPNQRNLFTFTAFSFSSDSVNNVALKFRARLNPIGAGTMRAVLRVNGTDYFVSQALTNSYADYTATWTTNPNTGNTWLEADVFGTGSNPLQQFGVDSNTGAHPEFRATQAYLVADFVLFVQGQPLMLRSTSVPGSRMWHPRLEFGRRFWRRERGLLLPVTAETRLRKLRG